MALNAVGLGLDERGAFAGTGTGNSLLGGLIHSKDILAVHDHTGHMITRRAVGDVLHIAGGAVRRGGSPAVHLVDEDHGQLPGGSDVHGLVESAAVGGTVTEEHHGNPVVLQDHLAGQGSAGGQVVAAAHDAVGAQHTHREVGNVHGAAAALAQAGLLAEDLSHHAVHIRALGHTVAVAAVSGLDHIVLPQSGAHTSGDGLLTDVQVHEAGNLTIQEVVLHALLKLADGAHGLIKVLRQFLGVFCCLCCCHRKNSLLPTLLSALFEICWDRCAGR